jgi:hypothetical protein
LREGLAGLRARRAEHDAVINTDDAEVLRRTPAAETTMWGALLREAGMFRCR